MTTLTSETTTLQNLDAARLRELLEPRSVAIIGANTNSTWSHFTHSNLLAGGFEGELYLVNRRGEECHGQASFASIADLPEAPDLAIVLTGTNSLETILEEARVKGIRNLILLASGLGEAGAEGEALQAKLVQRAREAGQLILGPNNLGFINSHAKVAAFSHMTQMPMITGGVGVASQSGALAIYLLPYMASRGVGCSMAVTVGNEAMVSAIDVMGVLVEDENTKVIAAYLEQISDPAQFLAVAARAREVGKPIVIFKAGRGEASARVAAAHTGSLVGDDKVIDAACKQFGIIRVDNIEDLVATAGIIESYGALPGNRMGVVTGSGAMCALVADKAESVGLELPTPSEATVHSLHEAGLPSFSTVNNPMDTTGYISVDPTILTKANQCFIDDPNYDFIVVNGSWPANQTMVDMGRFTQDELLRQLSSSPKPVIAMSFLPTEVTEFGRAFAAEHGYPHASDSFDRGIPAVARSAWWGKRTAELAVRRRDPGCPGHCQAGRRGELDRNPDRRVPALPRRALRAGGHCDLGGRGRGRGRGHGLPGGAEDRLGGHRPQDRGRRGAPDASRRRRGVRGLRLHPRPRWPPWPRRPASRASRCPRCARRATNCWSAWCGIRSGGLSWPWASAASWSRSSRTRRCACCRWARRRSAGCSSRSRASTCSPGSAGPKPPTSTNSPG